MDDTRAAGRPFWARRWRRLVAAALGALVLAFGVCEALGWPFLVGPLQRAFSHALDRRVVLRADPATSPQLAIHLLGGIRLDAAYLEIGAPAWSQAPRMLAARDAHLTLGYIDLWRASRGERLRIRALRAAQLDGQLERLADGRASWQFGSRTNTPDPTAKPLLLPSFGSLQVGAGAMGYRDDLLQADLASTFSLSDRSAGEPVGPESSAAASGAVAGAVAGAATGQLRFDAKGTYAKLPMTLELRSGSVLPLVADDGARIALPITFKLRSGRASFDFSGTATDALHLEALQGRFDVRGPSLAAVGDPLGVTLPTTGPFRAEGRLAKQGVVWNVVLDQVGIGSSRLAGALVYDLRQHVPLLAGRVTGSRLLLADLGPAFGASVAPAPGAVPMLPALGPKAPTSLRATSASGRVLPDRDFDLPALRVMNANVLIDIDDLDLGSSFLEPLKPAHVHLLLTDGVLLLRDFDARTGQGRLFGTLQLDGRNAQALWTTDLRLDGVRLESWIHQSRADNAPPYATGRLSGQARLAGQGKSTATILGSLRGSVRMQLADGTISHLAVEAAGLDIAQGLGMLVKGDDSLPIQCTVADLVAEQGVLRPRVLVLDTPDSTLWAEGSLSLATEALDLRVVSTPKDFSPLALRTPLRLRGTFAHPSVTLDSTRLGTRLGASALLAFVNPLAALIPLMDVGNSADARRGAQACRALSQQLAAKPLLPPPAAARAPQSVVKRATR